MIGNFAYGTLVLLSFTVTVIGNRTCPTLYTRFHDSCYKIFPYRFSWIEAQEFCKLDKAHLVFVDNETEHAFLKSLGNWQGSKITDQLWTGIIEFEGLHIRYAEVNTPAQYLDFVPGEPSSTPRDDCIALVKSKGWKMEDFGCDTNKFSFVCEY